MEESKEEWRPIAGYEWLYEVSNLGNVDSLNNYRRKQKRLRMVVSLDRNGYCQVLLSKKNKAKCYKIHRLVAMAFIPNPNNLPCINHKDEDKHNNFVYINEDGSLDLEKSNLEWCTVKYNNNYGTRKKRLSEKISFPVIQLTLDGKYIKKFNSITEAAKATYSRCSDIGYVCRGKMEQTNGFKWMYVDKEKNELAKLFKKERNERTIKNRNKGYEKHSRPVVQLSLSGDFIKEYRSVRFAGKETGINPSCIQGVCYHRRKTTNGYIFKFKDEIL